MLLELDTSPRRYRAAPPPRQRRSRDRRHRLAHRGGPGRPGSRRSRPTRSSGCSPPPCSRRSTTSPAVRAFSTGGVGGGSFLSIRGGEPNFTMVLIDGIRLNNPTNSRGGALRFLRDRSDCWSSGSRWRAARSRRCTARTPCRAWSTSGCARPSPGRDRADGSGERRQRGRCRPGARPQPWLARRRRCWPRRAGTTAAASTPARASSGARRWPGSTRASAASRRARSASTPHAERSAFPEDSGGPLLRRQPRARDRRFRRCAPARCRCAARAAPRPPRPPCSLSGAGRRERHPGDRAGRARRRSGARRRHPFLALRGDRRRGLRQGPADRDRWARRCCANPGAATA